MNFLRLLITLCLFSSYVNPVYAIPPPETLALLGGGIIYPGLLLIGALTVLLKYIWVKTKLYLVWRLYLARIFAVVLVSVICLKIPLSTQWWANNHPVSIQTIKYWQQSGFKPVFIDLRDTNSYAKAHLVGAINLPFGMGLTSYLKNNPDKRMILYCELGLRSAGPRWLDVDMSLLKQALDESRLFYFPGGFHHLMMLGEQTPVPIIINVPPVYANYLLKKPNISEIKWLLRNSGGPTSRGLTTGISEEPIKSSNHLRSDYEKIIAKHGVPIFNTDISPEIIADKFSPLNASHLYFTTSTKMAAYPLNSFLWVVSILFVTLFMVRRKEFFRGVFSEPTAAYKWINVFINMVTSVVVIQLGLFSLSIPFDYFLYKNTTDLPIDVGYLLSVYAFFGLIFCIHLMYPNRTRLNILQLGLRHLFAFSSNFQVNDIRIPAASTAGPMDLAFDLGPAVKRREFELVGDMKGASSYLKLPTLKELSIVSGILYGFYLFSCPLATIFLLSIFLLVPVLVDLLLYGIVFLFKNKSTNVLTLLTRGGYVCAPARDVFVQLNTRNELALARITVTIDGKSVNLGLFSGKILEQPETIALFLKDNDLQEITLMNYSYMIRHLLLFFQQDIELSLDSEMNIVSLTLAHSHSEARIINRHILLKHHQRCPGVISEKRFTSTIFQDVFPNPTPLMLDILKLRWAKKGGCLKALRKLGLLIKYNDKTTEQFIAFSNQLYLDETFEAAIFSASRLHIWVRKKILRITFRLAIDTILQDYYTIILPRTELRLTKLNESLDKPQSRRQLIRTLKRALTTLSRESAMWQCYCSLLHKHTFDQLQLEATNAACDLSSLISSPPSEPLSSYYEFTAKYTTLDSRGASEKSEHCSYYRGAFWKTETVRTYMRQLQLKEWQLINLLLEKLRNKFMLPTSLAHLIKEDFSNLPGDRAELINVLEHRQERWRTQNQWHFPPSFSLLDMEQLSTGQQEINPIEFHAIRVAGNQQTIMGNAVVFQDDLLLDRLPRGSILVADNLLPEQIIACQHINGVILKKGGYLSHTSILAREKNIPLIVQFQIAEIRNKDKLMVQSGNQVTILGNNVLEWEFLDGAITAAIGNKAQRLAIMDRQGFNIPATIILQHSSVEKIYKLAASDVSCSYYEELKQLLNVLTPKKSSIIVRSSTNLEDSSHYSYAGIFYSQANINTVDELILAIRASWQNLIVRSSVVKQYSGETQLALNLMLQPYIKGQFGGVLFTESSIPGRMHVEIAPGGVEGVTEGCAALTSLYIDEKGQCARAIGEKNWLSNQEYQVLYQLGREIEALFGKPQDIEWLLADQQFYIIQSRDISRAEIMVYSPCTSSRT